MWLLLQDTSSSTEDLMLTWQRVYDEVDNEIVEVVSCMFENAVAEHKRWSFCLFFVGVHTMFISGRNTQTHFSMTTSGCDTADLVPWTQDDIYRCIRACDDPGRPYSWRLTLRAVETGLMSVNASTGAGETLAHVAAHRCDLDVLRALKDLGANLSARDRYGYTPMHEAVRPFGSICGGGKVPDDETRLATCMMLPPQDIFSQCAGLLRTPLDFAIEFHHVAVALWMLKQPECTLQTVMRARRHPRCAHHVVLKSELDAAEARWARWSPLRAVWAGAVAASASAAVYI
jgi:hypothetical protein